jgi:5'-deoxynucleotidase YfbR-like HD superfamily hydrolase
VEGEVAKQLDKFEMIVQADEYERSCPGKKLQSFFDSTNDSFKHPEVCFTTTLPVIVSLILHLDYCLGK